MNKVEQKLSQLPKSPGVYFHKDAGGEIIYVGKAAVLRNRVRQYFQKSRSRDPKTDLLVAEIADVDWMVVDSEIEALFLEAEMIRRYMPRYNILLRDDRSLSFIRIDYDSDYPTVSTTRRPLDDGARYFGPYFSTLQVRQALKVLRRIFPFATRRIAGQKRTTLHYHLGLDPGLEEGKTTLEDYRANLRKLIMVIQGKRSTILRQTEKEMKRASKAQQFEEAAKLRNQLTALQNLGRQVIFSDKEFLDISKDHALTELAELLSLYEPQVTTSSELQGAAEAATPQLAESSGRVNGSASQSGRRLRVLRRIEGYDISHMQGTDVVASMVVFTNGASDKAQYRKFKTRRDQNDDFFNMHETLSRRLNITHDNAQGTPSHKLSRNAEWKWRLPDLVLIDGGKGQLDAAIRARDEAAPRQLRQGRTLTQIPFIGLAKREEQIVIKKSHGLRVKRQGAGDKSQLMGGEGRTGGSNVILASDVLQRLGGFATETDDFILLNLPHSTNLVKLLQRIRDESHRFAVSYHSVLKVKRQTASILDDIPGVGPATRKKLLRAFGSVKGVSLADEPAIAAVVGPKLARLVAAQLK